MKIALITDAWTPQDKGVATTLVELVGELRDMEHVVDVIHPGQFRTRPCPGHAGIDLAVAPGRQLEAKLDILQPDAIHISTEGPLGWAARRYCLRRGLAFSTAFHTRLPEILNTALKLPLSWGYALSRHFHRPSSAVMVPSHGVLRILDKRSFRHLRSWTPGVDTGLFRYHAQARIYPPLGALARPVQLYVGHVSAEKNIEAFLRLDVPGTKVVCGAGPQQATLRERFPQVHWLGTLPRAELALVYCAADVFVFPSRFETFGLVMLEAMACGTPIAAYPVDGPLDVLGQAAGAARGGALHQDLKVACYKAMAVPRHEARARALDFSWTHAAQLFASHLVPARQGVAARGGLAVGAVGTPV